MVNQLNQDPRADSIAGSGCGMAAMEGSEADAVGDEEVEGQDEGATVGMAPEAGVADLTWDTKDPFLKFISICVDACQGKYAQPQGTRL